MTGVVGSLLLTAWPQQEGSLHRMRECIERWYSGDPEACEATSKMVVEGWRGWSEEALEHWEKRLAGK
jgi:hypothetical protein